MLELRFLWKRTSQTTGEDKIFCAKKLDASMMPPYERALLNKNKTNKVCCKNLDVMNRSFTS